MDPEIPRLLTIPQFAARHAAFPEASLRWLVFTAGGPRAEPDISNAIVRVGRRVLLDEARFFQCLRGAPSTGGKR